MLELTFLKIFMLIRQSTSKKCIICHYWYFLDKGFKLQLAVFNGFLDVSVMSMNLRDAAILNICNVDYCIINEASKKKAINSLENANLSEKSGSL